MFYRIRNDCGATDYIATRGWSGEWLTAVRDAAQISRTTVWNVLGNVFRHTVLHRPWVPFSQPPAQDTFVRRNSCEASSVPRGVIHPWLRNTAGLPPGKLWHILLLSAPADFHRPLGDDDDPEPVEPLRSQPLMELCLGIPTWVMIWGGSDRLLLRIAFEKELPALVVRRLSKGFIDEGLQAVMRQNAHFMRELLLEGLLVKENILDRHKLEQSLSGGSLRGGPPPSELFAHLCTEAWLRVWQAT